MKFKKSSDKFFTRYISDCGNFTITKYSEFFGGRVIWSIVGDNGDVCMNYDCDTMRECRAMLADEIAELAETTGD